MKRTFALLAVTLVLVLALAAPAFAVSGAGGAGRDYGLDHVSHHAREMGGFTGEMNPGVHHQGFSGWPMDM
jgi:hypothetical protein